MKKALLTSCLLVMFTLSSQATFADAVADLGEEVWNWLDHAQPEQGDDVTRSIVRPDGWTPDWSSQAIAARQKQWKLFQDRWEAMANAKHSAAKEVDYQLIGSALARVRWDMEYLARWKRQPFFYVNQSITPVFTKLLEPPPFKARRVENILLLLENIPHTLQQAESNLTDMPAPFVKMVLPATARLSKQVKTMGRELAPYVDKSQHDRLAKAVSQAARAFDVYHQFLEKTLPELSGNSAIGREAYEFFLKKVALYPFDAEQLLRMGRQEWQRSVMFAEIERSRNLGIDELTLFDNIDAQVKQARSDEIDIRRYIEEKKLLTLPDGLGHFQRTAMPKYLAPIAWLGVHIDHTSAARPNENGTAYITDPSPNLGYFPLSQALDPRPNLVHEGMPGHYLQMVLSWQHPNTLRRRYYDSGANEGIAFYAEEMMLQAGLFDDSPKTREMLYSYLRLRALRVEVDVKLALGEFTIEQAADYLVSMVPMDHHTAIEEATFFASTPGQAISYQIGKLQIIDFLAEARRREQEAFDLQKFHDFVWLNGNVPIALQKQEYFSEK